MALRPIAARSGKFHILLGASSDIGFTLPGGLQGFTVFAAPSEPAGTCIIPSHYLIHSDSSRFALHQEAILFGTLQNMLVSALITDE